MIPIELRMEGIYGYREPVTVDFRPLTAARLFGIFGATGSGKSTILEAMTLALYTESARLNTQDKRWANMLNLRSSRLRVEFVFRARGNEYRCTVEVKRRQTRSSPAERQGGETGLPEMGALQRSVYRRADDGSWLPLDSTSGEEIIGLSYANFRRTVIIPQGQFQEFLQLTAGQRTRMMRDLFQLERFDLYDRVGQLRDATRLRQAEISSARSELPEELEQTRDELVERRERVREQRDATAAQRQAQQDRETELRRIEERAQRRDAVRARQTQLRAEGDDRATSAARVERLRYLRDVLHAPWTVWHDRDRRAREAREGVEEARAALAASDERLRAAGAQRVELERRQQRSPVIHAMIELAELDDRGQSLRAERDRLSAGLARVEARLAEENAAAEKRQAARAELEGQAIARDLLRELEHSVQAEQDYARRRSEFGARRAAVFAELAEAHPESAVPRSLGDVREQLSQARDAHAHRKQASRLASARSLLREGEPCPICGSVHHPAPVALGSDENGASEEELAARVSRLDRACDALERLAREEDALSRPAPHPRRSRLPAEPDAARAALDAAWSLHDRLDQLARDSQSSDAAILPLREQLAGERERQAAVSRELGELEERRKAVWEQLDADARDWYSHHADTEAGSRTGEGGEGITGDQRTSWERSLASIDRDLEAAREAEAAARSAHAGHESQLRERSLQLEALETERDAAAARLAGHGVDQPAALEPELAALPELPDLEQRLQRVQQEEEALQSELAALEAELQAATGALGIGASTEHIAGARRAAEEAREKTAHLLDEQAEELGRIRQQLDTVVEQVARRDALGIELEAVELRLERLHTLERLFRAHGFVAYVAQVYLEQLVAQANRRFRRLTRNQLELLLDDEGSFLVRDYLNDGKRRSVKTLSGGQTFQAALCLALALAESVEGPESSGEPGFFFLDEGFGALDRASLTEVFDTLAALRSENRIVGVISHVTELQAEIDAALLVRMDDERGSLIRSTLDV